MTITPWVPTHQHLKSGGLYRVITRGHMEADYPATAIVVYEDAEGRVFVRPAPEFDDGRFVALADHSPDTGKMVQPEPPADLVNKIAETICDGINGIGDGASLPIRFRQRYVGLAHSVLALLQPRLEAADGLLQAAEQVVSWAGAEVYSDDGAAKLAADLQHLHDSAIFAKAAGLGGGE